MDGFMMIDTAGSLNIKLYGTGINLDISAQLSVTFTPNFISSFSVSNRPANVSYRSHVAAYVTDRAGVSLPHFTTLCEWYQVYSLQQTVYRISTLLEVVTLQRLTYIRINFIVHHLQRNTARSNVPLHVFTYETLYYAYTYTCILYICTACTAIECFGSDSLGSCEILVNGCTVIVINLGAHKKIQVYLLASLEFTIMNFLLPRSFKFYNGTYSML